MSKRKIGNFDLEHFFSFPVGNENYLEVLELLQKEMQECFEMEYSNCMTIHEMQQQSSFNGNISLYTGITGSLYSLVKYCRVFKGNSIELEEIVSHLRLIIKSLNESQQLGGIYLTASGPYLVYLWTKQALDGIFDWENFQSFISQLNLSLEKLNVDGIPCEIANGKSGMLAALLMIKDMNPSEEMHEILWELSIKIKNCIYSEAFSNEILNLSWKWHGKQYLGAFHGIIGILTSLILTELTFPEASKSERKIQLLLGELERLLEHYQENGNHFSTIESENSSLIQFCHGEPGFVVCLMEIENRFPNFLPRAFLHYAREKCDLVIGKRGLLKKGFSLCHGISGNAYPFMQMYGIWGEERHLDFAIHFLKHVLARKTKELADSFGIPDHPHSLMEGECGILSFLVDMHELIRNQRCVFFPALFSL